MNKIYGFAGMLQITMALIVGIFVATLFQCYRDMIIESAYANGRQDVLMELPVKTLTQIPVIQKGDI